MTRTISRFSDGPNSHSRVRSVFFDFPICALRRHWYNTFARSVQHTLDGRSRIRRASSQNLVLSEFQGRQCCHQILKGRRYGFTDDHRSGAFDSVAARNGHVLYVGRIHPYSSCSGRDHYPGSNYPRAPPSSLRLVASLYSGDGHGYVQRDRSHPTKLTAV